jgi:nucleotide-binding universal stress UspA family protein
MAAKTILSIVGVDHDEADLLAVAEVARQSDMHLDCLVISCVPPPPLRDIGGQAYSMYASVWEQENNRVNGRTAELRDLLASRQFSADVQPVYCLTGSVGDEVAKRAMYADYTLIGPRMLRDESLLGRVLDGALFSSPAPVILFSDSRQVNLAPKTVLVAWNSTRQCALAVRQSMDMILHAKNVHIALVDPIASASAMGEEPGADAATYLARRGAQVTIDTLASGGRDPALVLQRQAEDIGAELIVMGAYGHSRLRERIFGGTTQTTLSHVGTPVLMAH